MKKNELVHYHALLRYISTDFVERGIAAREDFDEYEQLDVSPMSLRASRDRHEEAVLALAEILSLAARHGGGEHAPEETTADVDSSPDERALTSR